MTELQSLVCNLTALASSKPTHVTARQRAHEHGSMQNTSRGPLHHLATGTADYIAHAQPQLCRSMVAQCCRSSSSVTGQPLTTRRLPWGARSMTSFTYWGARRYTALQCAPFCWHLAFTGLAHQLQPAGLIIQDTMAIAGECQVLLGCKASVAEQCCMTTTLLHVEAGVVCADPSIMQDCTPRPTTLMCGSKTHHARGAWRNARSASPMHQADITQDVHPCCVPSKLDCVACH